MADVIYKVAPTPLWLAARAAGRLDGSADDLRDGFIHLSTAAQVARTLERHFAGQAELVLAEVSVARLGGALRWEPSSSGGVYPHLYAALPISAVVREWRLRPDPKGGFALPPELSPC